VPVPEAIVLNVVEPPRQTATFVSAVAVVDEFNVTTAEEEVTVPHGLVAMTVYEPTLPLDAELIV
jgi:hypothetical protein